MKKKDFIGFFRCAVFQKICVWWDYLITKKQHSGYLAIKANKFFRKHLDK